MSTLLSVKGYEARYTAEARDHWLVKGASELGEPIICKPSALSRTTTDCDLIFVSVKDEKRVTHFLKELKNVRVVNISATSVGILADTICKETEFVNRMGKLHGSVSIIAKPQGMIEVLLRSPWESDIDALKKTLRKKSIRWPKGKMETRETTIQVDVPIGIGKFDEKEAEELAETARILIDSGYYEPKRPEGLTHDVLSQKLEISKPTLEKRIRKLESLGIRSLFGKLSKEDIEAAWNAFRVGSAKVTKK